MGRAAGGRAALPFHPCSSGALPSDPALTLPTRQRCPRCPLGRTGFVRGRWRGCGAGRLPALALRARWSWGSLPGAAGQGKAALSAREPRDREKGAASPFQHSPSGSAHPFPIPAAGDFPALPTERITLIHGEGFTRVSTGALGLALAISNRHGLGSVN